MQMHGDTWSCRQDRLSVNIGGRGFREITVEVADAVTKSRVDTGLCHVFVQHTSASLIVCENADPQVLDDMEAYMARLVADGDPMFTHRSEGADDMAAHVRSVLTSSGLTLPIAQGRLALGTWQGLYLWEHRFRRFQRNLMITVHGLTAAHHV